ncbi:MAG: putative manganese-dependent inorganic diphosphatase [Deltaproteobacteria bacterium]|jgi:manganese-dependent inorganic pyrophosphatase|nr:putative manganese-dependent inorganic diphosphatase [Deltaproteobacteria bacterium]
MSQHEKILVIGHCNPDTDSICSAIAYADLCFHKGYTNVRPARAGTLNRQTEFVLDWFAHPIPDLVTDVFPRIRDVLSGEPVSIFADLPLMKALELMRRHDIRMLPVLECEGEPIGALVLKRLTDYIFLTGEGSRIRQVLTTPASIQTCLRASPVLMFDSEEIELFQIFVGAMSKQSFEKHLKDAVPQKTIVLTGDREDIQQIAIEKGVRLLIVTGGLNVSRSIISAARSQKVSILKSPFDTATSALMSRMSTPVRHLLEGEIPQCGLDDRIEKLKRLLERSKFPGALVLDRQGKLRGVATKSNLFRRPSVGLILVDHNEISQAVPGADQVDILEVIDHHRLGNFHTDTPIKFINQPLGSTCSVVATLYRDAGLTPKPQIAGLMLAGLLSDTILLRSPTTTKADHDLVEWLSLCAGCDAMNFGQKMFEAGSALSAYADVESLLTSDFKEYSIGNSSIGVGQIEVVNFQDFEERRDIINEGLKEMQANRNLGLVALLVTDIVEQTSLLLVQGDYELIDRIGYPQLDNNLFELKGVLSRKKQLMPHLIKAFKQS